MLLTIMALAFSPGCSMQKLAIRATGTLLTSQFKALLAEEDLMLARSAIESDLKLLEGLILADPGNEELLLQAAQGFSSYAFAFVEDEDTARAFRLYRRGRDYANRFLAAQFKADLLSEEKLADFDKTIDLLPEKAAPGVFWLAYAWASMLNLSLDNVASVAAFPRVEALMQFVIDHDEGYYYGSAHLFFTAYLGGKPPMLGGDRKRALEHLRRCRELTGGTFLMADFFQVKYIHLPSMDEEAARLDLQGILKFDLERAPDIRLMNRVVQEKAGKLLDNLDEYF